MKLLLKIFGILIALVLLVFILLTLYVKKSIDKMNTINDETTYKITKAEQLLTNVKSNSKYTLNLKNNDTIYYFHFWATYCEPCIEEFDKINANYDKIFKGKTKLIIISFESIDRQKAFLKKQNYKMNFYTTDSISFFTEPNIKYLPTTIVSENEKVTGAIIGKFNWTNIN